MERRSFLATAGALAAVAASASPSLAVLGDSRSDSNIFAMRNRLQGYVDQLQQDQRDYGGHRAAAIAWLQRAINELTAALNYDKTHQ